MGSGGTLLGEEENRGTSLHCTVTQKKMGAGGVGVCEIVEEFRRRHLIAVERNKVTADLGAFTSICMEFMDKIDGLQLENSDLMGRIKKYEGYFK